MKKTAPARPALYAHAGQGLAPEFDLSSAKPLGQGQICLRGLASLPLLSLLAAYKKRTASQYRSILPEQIGEIPLPCHASVKIDGESWNLVATENLVCFANPRGHCITGPIPALLQAEILKEAAREARGVVIIPGELFRQSGKGEPRPRHSGIAALLAAGKSADTAMLAFAAYDIAGSRQSYAEKIRTLQAWLGKEKKGRLAFCIDPARIESHDELHALFNKACARREEGLVAKTDQGTAFKIKPMHSIDAAIIGYSAGAGEPEIPKAVLFSLIDADGRHYACGSCANLGTMDERRALLAGLKKIEAPSSARIASPGGSLFIFCKPEFAAEFSTREIASADSFGDSLRKPLLAFEKGAWKSLGSANAPSLSSPVLLRMRPDKRPGPDETGLAQIADYILPAPKSPGKLPQSALLLRRAWTKGAGNPGVRKVLVWKTNKEQLESAEQFPPYAVFWTDYSPNRAEPLERAVYPAPDRDSAMAIAEQLIAENIKKGWAEAAVGPAQNP